MRKLFRKIAYSKFATRLLTAFCGIFYDKKYLAGKFFETKRIGFVWCLASLARLPVMRCQHIWFPIGKNTSVLGGENIHFHPNSINVFQQPGCYFKAFAPISIGKDVWIAQNVGIITANHDLCNPEEHCTGKPVSIGDYCWIGMNSVVLPGVVLGNHTIVGAGSVVTKSFPEGNVVIAGNPAKIIKYLPSNTKDKEGLD